MVQMVKNMEENILCFFFSTQKLHIVNGSGKTTLANSIIKNLKKEIKVLQKAANKVTKMLDKVNKKNAI